MSNGLTPAETTAWEGTEGCKTTRISLRSPRKTESLTGKKKGARIAALLLNPGNFVQSRLAGSA